jgi:hypothetical protein
MDGTMQYSKRKREEARRLFLTGEASTVAEIARRLKSKPHTVAGWKKEEDWDALRITIEKRAAEQLVEKLASERVTIDLSHYKMWRLVVSQLLEAMKRDQGMTVQNLREVAGILEKAQRGERLARGMSLDGENEQQVRAQAAVENRQMVDVFVEVVKKEIRDEELRDRIARAVLNLLPREEEEPAGEPN